MTVGYEEARAQGEAVARVLRDMARLIGEPASEPVTLETGGTLVPGLGLGEEASLLSGRARDLSQGLFKIIVLGEFKNGKSTLLNSLLGNKTLPAKAAPATAIITVLVYGESDRVTIFESDRPEPRTVSWEEFVREFQLTLEDQETLQGHGAVDRFQNVVYAQVECRHPICANGVKLVDSPGLGEHISRTRVATEFLKQSQAVVFVLNASRLLTRDEREFIENVLGRGRLSHVFFVVNRVDQVGGGVDEIRSWVKEALAPHFLDEQGSFDEDFYRRRVFFTDARSALEARMAQPIDETRLESSGVLRLEAELERFLTGEEKVAATIQSTAQTLIPVIREAERRIAGQKAALDQPLEELERRHAEVERQLDALQSRKHEIERTVVLFGDMVKQKIYTDLHGYVEEMHERWLDESRQLVDLDSALSLKNIMTSYAQAEARDRMSAAIAEQVQRYLQIKFQEWADRVPAVVERDVEKMVAEVEAQVEDFELELDTIAGVFSGIPPRRDDGDRPTSSLMSLALSWSDISGMTDEIMHPQDWSNAIGRIAQQAVAVLIVGTFLTGGNFLIALIIVEAFSLGLHESEVKKRIRQGVGDRLHENLREQIDEKRAFIYEAIGSRFRAFAAAMTEVLQRQIDEVRAEQQRILDQKRDEHFSVGVEKRRLDAIHDKLQELLQEIEVGGRVHAG